jgi:diguanylate cyclase
MTNPKLRRSSDHSDLGELMTRIEALLNPTVDFEKLVLPLLEQMREATGVESAFVTEIDWVAHTQKILHAVNHDESWVWPADVAIDWSDTMCRRVFLSGRESTQDAVGDFPDSFLANAMGVKTYVSIPLCTDEDHVIGTLCAASRAPIPLDDERHKLMRLIAHVIAVRLETAQRQGHVNDWSTKELAIQARMESLTTGTPNAAGSAWRARRRAHQDGSDDATATPSNLITTDPLTGVFNLRGLVAGWEELLVHAARRRTPLAAAAVDVDGFTKLNRDYGQTHGDDILRAVARGIRRSTGAEDLVGRVGPDEFVVVMPHAQLDDAERRVKGLIAELGRTALGIYPMAVSISAGISSSAETAIDGLVEAALASLAEARSQGQGHVESWPGGALPEPLEEALG